MRPLFVPPLTHETHTLQHCCKPMWRCHHVALMLLSLQEYTQDGLLSGPVPNPTHYLPTPLLTCWAQR
jgi:hypothetical protein